MFFRRTFTFLVPLLVLSCSEECPQQSFLDEEELKCFTCNCARSTSSLTCAHASKDFSFCALLTLLALLAQEKLQQHAHNLVYCLSSSNVCFSTSDRIFRTWVCGRVGFWCLCIAPAYPSSEQIYDCISSHISVPLWACCMVLSLAALHGAQDSHIIARHGNSGAWSYQKKSHNNW